MDETNRQLILDHIKALGSKIEDSNKDITSKIDEIKTSISAMDSRITTLETVQDMYWKNKWPDVEERVRDIELHKASKVELSYMEQDLREFKKEQATEIKHLNNKLTETNNNLGTSELKIKFIITLISLVSGGAGSFLMTLLLRYFDGS